MAYPRPRTMRVVLGAGQAVKKYRSQRNSGVGGKVRPHSADIGKDIEDRPEARAGRGAEIAGEDRLAALQGVAHDGEIVEDLHQNGDRWRATSRGRRTGRSPAARRAIRRRRCWRPPSSVRGRSAWSTDASGTRVDRGVPPFARGERRRRGGETLADMVAPGKNRKNNFRNNWTRRSERVIVGSIQTASLAMRPLPSPTPLSAGPSYPAGAFNFGPNLEIQGLPLP